MECVRQITVRKASDTGNLIAFGPGGICVGYIPNKADIDAMSAPSALSLSAVDGLLVAGAVASVWISAWIIRQIVVVMKDRDEE